MSIYLAMPSITADFSSQSGNKTSHNIFTSVDDINTIEKKYSYICVVSNLDYLLNKRKFNKYLNKFMGKCHHYEINLYNKINNNFHIFEQKHIRTQIYNAKKHIINNHIISLQHILNTNMTGDAYFTVNNKIVYMTHKILLELDKLLKLTEYIYMYNLLCITDTCKSTFECEYVDFSEINDAYDVPNQEYIDEYK